MFFASGVLALILSAIGVLVFSNSERFNLETIMHSGHIFEMIVIALVFGLILLPNIIRMWWFIILKPDIKIPVSKYFTGLKELALHMFTQKRALDCDENRFRWFEHFILVIGYLYTVHLQCILQKSKADDIRLTDLEFDPQVKIPGYRRS